ncbi:MAG: DUF3299 domain-containing protein [Armatimonadota bacterium]|nr:DUF3299 domain-containing protein [bacterium]
MIRVRRKRLFIYGLPVILALFAADYAYSFIVQRSLAARDKPAMQISVRTERGVTGHNTIGIDEGALGAGSGEHFLHFATLGDWNFTIDSRPSCPKPIQSLSGRRFDCVGFMYPLQTGDKIKDFCLLRSTQTCCYGPRPQFNQYILVEMKEPVKFQRLTPVMISGKFVVEPKPDDGYIYRMEGDSLSNIGDDVPDVDPVKSAKQAKLPLFDYTPLMAMAKRPKLDGVANDLRTITGKRVVVAGYCVSRSSSQPPRLILAKSWWDGVAQGTPPTVYNAIAVFPGDAGQVPPLWKPFQVFTGTLKVTTDPTRWNKDGIVQLHNAQLGVPGVTRSIGLSRSGPFIPLDEKLIVLAAFLLLTLKWQKRESA